MAPVTHLSRRVLFTRAAPVLTASSETSDPSTATPNLRLFFSLDVIGTWNTNLPVGDSVFLHPADVTLKMMQFKQAHRVLIRYARHRLLLRVNRRRMMVVGRGRLCGLRRRCAHWARAGQTAILLSSVAAISASVSWVPFGSTASAVRAASVDSRSGISWRENFSSPDSPQSHPR